MGLIWEVTQNSGGFPGGSVVKNSPANAGDVGWIPGLGRSPGEGNGNPLQCSCLENPMDRGAWWATVHGVAESETIEQLKNNNLLRGTQVAVNQGPAVRPHSNLITSLEVPSLITVTF